MDQKTLDHLRVAERNRNLARALLSAEQPGLQPAPWEWVAVILFYSAVHYVNAYLWEQYHHEPLNHGERSRAVNRDPALIACRRRYDDLRDAGYRARYDEQFYLREQDARLLLDVRLRQVEATVMQALGQPVPVW